MIQERLSPSPPQVWAVEDTSAQLTWGELPPGPVVASVADRRTAIDHPGGPGAVEVNGLAADAPFSIELAWNGGRTVLSGRTVVAPPGRLLARFATISDLHLGAMRWGLLQGMSEATMTNPVQADEPHPYRCAHAAVSEAVRWGAELLIIKGDAVQHERPADFEELGRLVDDFPSLPMLLIPGNHDLDRVGRPPAAVGRRALAYTRVVDHVDLPGVRVLVADTAIPGSGRGRIDRVADDIVAGITSSSEPCFVGIHHQLQPGRIARHWPIGVTAPASTAFLDRLDRLGRPIMISAGHTHRNRSRRHGRVTLTEVASTKDWPGVWAGYAVHEGGIRQVVRRIASPTAIAWTEYSRRAVGGLWGRWSPGPLDQRCLVADWSGADVAAHSLPDAASIDRRSSDGLP